MEVSSSCQSSSDQDLSSKHDQQKENDVFSSLFTMFLNQFGIACAVQSFKPSLVFDKALTFFSKSQLYLLTTFPFCLWNLPFSSETVPRIIDLIIISPENNDVKTDNFQFYCFVHIPSLRPRETILHLSALSITQFFCFIIQSVETNRSSKNFKSPTVSHQKKKLTRWHFASKNRRYLFVKYEENRTRFVQERQHLSKECQEFPANMLEKQ